MYCLSGVFLLVIAIPGALGSVEVSMPKHVDAEVGHPVRIPCSHTVSGTSSEIMVEWFIVNKHRERQRIAYKDETNSVTDPDTPYAKRVSMDGDYSLLINKVEVMDERPFFCQVIAGASGSQEGKTQLKVYDTPQEPEVESNPATLSVNEQHPSEIGSCASRNGYPAPTIVWYKDGVMLQSVTTHNPEMYMIPRIVKEASGLFTVTNRLYMKLSKADKDSVYRCRVLYQTLNNQTQTLDSETFQVTLHYNTEHVTFNLTSDSVIREGDNVTLRCFADGFPQPEYAYYRMENDEETDLANSKNGLFTLANVRKDDSGTYVCEALDFDAPDDVVLKKQLNVVVNYIDPPVLSLQGPIILPKGKDVQISCTAHGSVTPKVIWKKGKATVSDSGNLTLEGVSYHSAGSYVCEAKAPAIRGLKRSQSIEVHVQGEPEVQSNSRSLTVQQEGVKVTLTCTALGYPRANITWNISKRPVVTPTDNAVISQVSFPVTKRLAQDGVTCNATNKYGSALRHFQLAIGGRGSHGSGGAAIIAVVVCILLLLLVVAILYCLHRKGKLTCGKSEKKDTMKLGSEDQCLREKTDN
ncbi:basal cell adhesion molecule-like isoform X2 [Hemiscyllium ocellatum]|uniref:basal cell adhesion molecule-like isoform X2 n=1 Tax=Hemiscyllium ocellatum TaxID=170820 RepID=UPI002966298E|nr:basal cell adhesion molecule-like isoform X2 [Hemiscyllium ocellatum]